MTHRVLSVQQLFQERARIRLSAPSSIPIPKRRGLGIYEQFHREDKVTPFYVLYLDGEGRNTLAFLEAGFRPEQLIVVRLLFVELFSTEARHNFANLVASILWQTEEVKCS